MLENVKRTGGVPVLAEDAWGRAVGPNKVEAAYSGSRPLRTLYAFDPQRSAILLIGGDKTGDDRWYDMHVPIADRLYDEHLEQFRKEGLIDG